MHTHTLSQQYELSKKYKQKDNYHANKATSTIVPHIGSLGYSVRWLIYLCGKQLGDVSNTHALLPYI